MIIPTLSFEPTSPIKKFCVPLILIPELKNSFFSSSTLLDDFHQRKCIITASVFVHFRRCKKLRKNSSLTIKKNEKSWSNDFSRFMTEHRFCQESMMSALQGKSEKPDLFLSASNCGQSANAIAPLCERRSKAFRNCALLLFFSLQLPLLEAKNGSLAL